jgi:hypothetical protein
MAGCALRACPQALDLDRRCSMLKKLLCQDKEQLQAARREIEVPRLLPAE